MISFTSLTLPFLHKTFQNFSLAPENHFQALPLWGHNGAGKTLFFQSLCLFFPLQRPSDFFVQQEKITPQNRAKFIAFKSTQLPLDQKILVEDYWNLASYSLSSFQKKEFVEKKYYYSKLFEVDSFRKKIFQELSEGQKQKVDCCRVFLQQTPVILLDEPLSFLDYSSQGKFLELIQKLAHEEKKLILFSLHDAYLLTKFFSHCLVLEQKLTMVTKDFFIPLL